MWKIVAILALTVTAIVTGHIADQAAALQLADAAANPPLMYAGIRG